MNFMKILAVNIIGSLSFLNPFTDPLYIFVQRSIYWVEVKSRQKYEIFFLNMQYNQQGKWREKNLRTQLH